MDVFMRDSDAFSWYMEGDPVLRSTVVAVAWLERSPDWDMFVAKLDEAVRQIPFFRQRVLEPPARLTTPRWAHDGSFDLMWHLRRVDSPVPHTPDTVLALARIAAMTAFDRAHPLWEFGLGGMQLALLLFDVDPISNTLDPVPTASIARRNEGGSGRFGTGGVLGQSLARDLDRLAELVGHAATSAAPSAVRAARHPLACANAILETVKSIGRTVAPVRSTLSPVMTDRGLTRHLEMLEVSLADLKRAAAAAGGSVNDGFMAAVTGGFRRYHEHHGAAPEKLRVTLPISIRTPEDPVGGNRITLMRFAVPVSEADPASRIKAIARLCRAARSERSLPLTDAIAGVLNFLPQVTVGSMLKHVDFLASDVPGFTFPVYLAGARLERYVAFGPTIGSSANLTLLSYDGTCGIGVTIDTAAVPDADVLVDCLREGFEEVLALGGSHDSVRMPMREILRC